MGIIIPTSHGFGEAAILIKASYLVLVRGRVGFMDMRSGHTGPLHSEGPAFEDCSLVSVLKFLIIFISELVFW